MKRPIINQLDELAQKLASLPRNYVLIVVLVAGIAGGVAAKTWFPIFEAQAKLSVGIDLKVQEERIISRPVILQTIYALQGQHMDFHAVSPKMLESGLLTQQIKNSDVLLVGFRHPDPKVAATILNTWCLTFMAHDQFAQQQDQIKEREYLESQLKQKQDLIESAENEKRTLRHTNPTDKITMLRVTKKIEAMSQAYDKILGQYRQILIDQTEPQSKVMFVESAQVPKEPLHPYFVLVFIGVFLSVMSAGLASLFWIKKPQPRAQEAENPFLDTHHDDTSFVFPQREPLSTFDEEDVSIEISPVVEETLPQWEPLAIAQPQDEIQSWSPTRQEPEPATEPPAQPQPTPQITPQSEPVKPKPKPRKPTVSADVLSQRDAILDLPIFKKRSVAVAITALHLRKLEMTWILSLIQPLVEAGKKVVLVSLSDSETMAKFFQLPPISQNVVDYMRGTALPNVLQATPIRNLSWIPADGAMPVIASEESLSFLTRRLKMYFDAVVYTHTFWEEEVTHDELQNFVEGWVVLEAKGQNTHEVLEYLSELQQPILAQVPL